MGGESGLGTLTPLIFSVFSVKRISEKTVNQENRKKTSNDLYHGEKKKELTVQFLQRITVTRQTQIPDHIVMFQKFYPFKVSVN